ncbi:hypothetical protein TEQG_06847 [Trichophyton equinum CBS 127.97]|uniref:Uncharacterized protein n=1 Tax=Trichophyton equinum (strain ATCC MYA-4606 / CBS 127.97) TaxID=559882 RepID=F2Q151_TRIEC|nr:hypothetical protein TEQG_06847 [Trichophyton equinum CBS 127.97]
MSVLPIVAEVIPLLAQRLGIQRLSYLCLFVRVSGPRGCSCLWGKQERCTADSHPSGAVGLNQAASQGEHEDEDDEDERESKTKTLVSGGTSGREEQRVEGGRSSRRGPSQCQVKGHARSVVSTRSPSTQRSSKRNGH